MQIAQLDETLGLKTQLEGNVQQPGGVWMDCSARSLPCKPDLQAGLDEDRDIKLSLPRAALWAPELEAAIGAEGEEVQVAAKVTSVGMLTAGVAASHGCHPQEEQRVG